jgi:hypothetical protein
MRKSNFLIILLFSTVIASCIFKVPNHSDNAYENINDVSIRLIIRHPMDSLVRTDYEKRNQLPGNYCAKLETVEVLDSNLIHGVAIRFWTDIVMKEQGNFYGAYPKNGILDKITNVNVVLSNSQFEKDITHELMGDSTINAYVWKKHNYKKSPLSNYIKDGGLKPVYFENTDHWTQELNHHADTLEWVSRYDYLFWFNNKTIRNLSFEPEWLKIRVTLTDSTLTKNRMLTDSIAMVKL